MNNMTPSLFTLINNMIEHLDKIIILDKINYIPSEFSLNYNLTQKDRIFFLSRFFIESLLPNQGKILNYPLAGNICNLIYNYFLRTEGEFSFMLKHNISIFNRNGDLYNLLKSGLMKLGLIKVESINKSLDSVEIAASKIISYSPFDLENFDYETWDELFDDIKYLNRDNIFNNCDGHPFYRGLNELNSKIIKIRDFSYTFFYKYKIQNCLSSVILKADDFFIDDFKIKFSEFIPIFDLKSYFFEDNYENNNIFITYLNNLDKNEINFKFIWNFVQILYNNPDTSYLHLYINIHYLIPLKNAEELIRLAEVFDEIIDNRIIYCQCKLQEHNKQFLNLVGNDNFLDVNKGSEREQIIDFLEESNGCNDTTNSHLMKEYFLLRTIKIILYHFFK